jgi:hypothetical protein
VKNGAAAAREADRGSSSAADFGENRVDLAWNDLGDGRKPKAVFVAEWKITEQIGDPEDAAFLESGGALGTNPAQIFNWIAESDGHEARRKDCARKLHHFYTIGLPSRSVFAWTLALA